ncbi:pyrroloquinoline quinone precursor peptide PqqA [Fulvimarina pelagi]
MHRGWALMVRIGQPATNIFGRHSMAWNKPVITEVCVAMEINGYMPIEF